LMVSLARLVCAEIKHAACMVRKTREERRRWRGAVDRPHGWKALRSVAA
jgi:hypothetical protein